MEQMVRQVEPTPLYGAAKLVGTIGARTTVGLMSALTGPNDVEVERADGTRELRRIDPWAAYNILRLKRKLAANAEIGVLATATNRVEAQLPVDALCPVTGLPAPADGRCTNDAYVFSTDGRWRSAQGNYSVAWQAIGSTLRNGPERIEPDGKNIKPGAFAAGGSLYVGKDGGKNWLWSAWQHVAGPMLEFNDVGYLERKNDYQALPLARLPEPRRVVDHPRATWNALQVSLRETLDGLTLWRDIRLATSTTFRNFWSYYFNIHARGSYFDDRETGDGTALQRTASAGVSGEIGTDPRRPLTFWMSSTFDLRRGGGVIFGANGVLALRALSRLELALLPTVGYESGAPRYVSKDAPASGNGRSPTTSPRRRRPPSARRCAPPSPSPPSCRCSGTRSCFSRASTTVRTSRSGNRPAGASCSATWRRPVTDAATADTETATLNINVVLRWEYRLGSTLFVVYTRAQNPALSPSMTNPSELRAAPAAPGAGRRQRAHGQAGVLVRLAAPVRVRRPAMRPAAGAEWRPRHSETAPRDAA